MVSMCRREYERQRKLLADALNDHNLGKLRVAQMLQQDLKKKAQIIAGVFSFYSWIIEALTIKLTWEGADSLFPPRDSGTGPMLASTCNL